MKKRNGQLAALLLAIVMILSFSVTPLFAAGDQTFKDVPESAWYHGYVEMLYDKGIVKGYGDTGEFRPNNTLIREHAAKMIALAAGLAYQGKKADFPDVDKEGEMSPYIAALKDKGAIQGFPDGTFRPFANIERGHAAKIVALAFGLLEGDMVSALTDLPQDADVKTAIKILESNGVVKGYGNTKLFKPEEEINRAEFAKILCIAMVVASIQKAEADPTPANIAAAQALADQLPQGQDAPTQSYLQGRLDELGEEEEPGGGTVVPPVTPEIRILSVQHDAIERTIAYRFNTEIKLVKQSGDDKGKEISASEFNKNIELFKVYKLDSGNYTKDQEAQRPLEYASWNANTKTLVFSYSYVHRPTQHGAGHYLVDAWGWSITNLKGVRLDDSHADNAENLAFEARGINLVAPAVYDAELCTITYSFDVEPMLVGQHGNDFMGQIIRAEDIGDHSDKFKIYKYEDGNYAEGDLAEIEVTKVTWNPSNMTVEFEYVDEDALIEAGSGLYIVDSISWSITSPEGVRIDKTDQEMMAKAIINISAAELLAIALGAQNTEVDETTVALKSDVSMIRDIIVPQDVTLTILEDVTLKTDGKLIGGSGTIRVHGTIDANGFVDVAPFLISGGAAMFHKGCNLLIVDDGVSHAFIGGITKDGAYRETMSVDEGFVTIGIHAHGGAPANAGFKLTIPQDSQATIKGYHLDKDEDGYRIATNDLYLVEGVLNINYRTDITGLLQVTQDGKINVATNILTYLWGTGEHADRLLSPIGTVLGANGSKIINHRKAKAGTLNDADIESEAQYEWINSEWVKLDAQGT